MSSDSVNSRKFSCQLSYFPDPFVREIIIKGAPSFMTSLRALFVTDVHLRRQVSDNHLNQLIRTMAALNADILLLGGDYGEGEDQCVRFFDALSSLHFPLGSYAVPGNNDRHKQLKTILSKRGVTLLHNRKVSIPIKENMLTIGGVDEIKYGKADASRLFKNKDDYRILLSHFPVDFSCKIDLQLSGHTHAGQWKIGNFTPYSLGFEKRFGIRAIEGLHILDDHQLFIGNGIGISKLPLRINADPEIYILRFVN